MPLVALLLWAFTLSAQPQSDFDVATSPAPLRWRLHREIQTSVPRASQLFDAGLSLLYAYRHRDAVDAFRAAQRADARCVMCVLGEVLALGPTVTSESGRSVSDARAALARAEALLSAGAGTPSDAAWFRAMATRYSADPATPRATLDSAFARAMSELALSSQHDADAHALAAEAWMILSPYEYWTANGVPRPGTRRLLAHLDAASRLAPGHHGARFFAVHVMEGRSGNPQVASLKR